MGQLHVRGRPELAQEARAVGAHGFRTDTEPIGDLGPIVTLTDHDHYRKLARGESSNRRVLGAQPPEREGLRDVATDEALTAMHFLQGHE